MKYHALWYKLLFASRLFCHVKRTPVLPTPGSKSTIQCCLCFIYGPTADSWSHDYCDSFLQQWKETKLTTRVGYLVKIHEHYNGGCRKHDTVWDNNVFHSSTTQIDHRSLALNSDKATVSSTHGWIVQGLYRGHAAFWWKLTVFS